MGDLSLSTKPTSFPVKGCRDGGSQYDNTALITLYLARYITADHASTVMVATLPIQGSQMKALDIAALALAHLIVRE
jgi:hypothetical protein